MKWSVDEWNNEMSATSTGYDDVADLGGALFANGSLYCLYSLM